MVIAIIAGILLVTLVLACIGSYIVIHKSNKEKDTEEVSKIAVSGKYAAVLRPAADSLAEKKPSKTELEGWLNAQGISKEQKDRYLENWQNSINEIVKTINDGDMNGVTTYRVAVGQKDKNLCRFLPPDHFITRDQINRNAELLPPYCFGSDSVIAPKLPWEKSDGSGGWKAVLPKDGRYEVPDWRQMV